MNQISSCLCRVNYCIYIPFGSCHIRVGKLLFVLLHFEFSHSIRILCLHNLLLEDNICSALRPHNGNLCQRPGEYKVCPQVAGVHCDVTSAVCFSKNYCNLWNGCLAICIEQFSSVTDNTCVLLVYTRQIARKIFKSYYRDVECVAEKDKSCS